MTENKLWTGCVTDFRALDLGRKKSWGWEPDFRALDPGRKKSRVREPIFHALDPKNGTSRVWEPIFHALDPSMRERSLHNTEKQAMVGSGRRKTPRWTRKRRKDHAALGLQKLLSVPEFTENIVSTSGFTEKA